MKRFLALAAIAALLSGCSKSADQSGTGGRHSWTVPNLLRVAVQGEPKNLNPLLAGDTIDGFVTRLMFEPLVSVDAKGNSVPMLAAEVPTLDNGGISKDGLTITYHLDKRARWTDGQPVTSKDVKFSWQALMNPNNNVVSRHGYDEISSIDTPDDATVVVHLKEKFAPFVNTFFGESDQPYTVVPEHVLAKYPNLNQIPFNNEPTVSDGPFRFAEWVHNDHISFVKNDTFFKGPVGLDHIDIKIVPDENTSVNLLRTHSIDWIYQASIRTYPSLKDIPDANTVWVDVNGFYSIMMNSRRGFLNDLRVREAIAYGIDKKNLVDTTSYGQEKVATEDIPDFMWAFDPNVKSLGFDPAKSRQLLAEAGFARGSDGIMQKGGQPLSLLLVTENSNITYKQLAVQYQREMHDIGIDVEIKLVPLAQLYAPAGEGGVLQLGQYDVAVYGWYSGIDPDDSAQLMCKNLPPGGYNYSRYCTPAMDAAQKMALSNYDFPTRKKAYAAIQALLARDVPIVYINWLRQQEPISVDFKGFAPNPVIEDWNAWQWSI